MILPLLQITRWLRTAKVVWQHSFTTGSCSSGISTKTFNGGGVTILGGMFSWLDGGKDWLAGGKVGSNTGTGIAFSSPNLGV